MTVTWYLAFVSLLTQKAWLITQRFAYMFVKSGMIIISQDQMIASRLTWWWKVFSVYFWWLIKSLGSDIGFYCNYKRCLCSQLYRDSIIMLPENYYLVIKMSKCYSNQIHAENYWLVFMMLHIEFFPSVKHRLSW